MLASHDEGLELQVSIGIAHSVAQVLTMTGMRLLQAWFQEVAWTEAEKPIKLAARAAMLPDDPSMARQPLFCFQTMLNLLYWSCLVYDHNRVGLGFGLPYSCHIQYCTATPELLQLAA